MSKIMTHKKICEEINALYAAKNEDYGDSFASARKLIPGYAAGKLYDKVMRFITLTEKGEHNARVADEKLEDTLKDLACYAIMEIVEMRLEQEKIALDAYTWKESRNG